MKAPLDVASRRLRVLSLLVLLSPPLCGCGSWQRTRNLTLRAPVAFTHRVLVIGAREAWELEVARVEDVHVVGRCLRRWNVPAGADHRWASGDLSPDATAAINRWTVVPAEPAELAIARGEVRHLLYLSDGGGPAAAFVASALLALIALVTGGFAISGGRID